VFRRVDLEVPSGALGLVTGPAGCGKTALLLTLAARMRPTAGALLLGDCDAVAQPRRARHLVGLGETAGVNELDPTLTVATQTATDLAMHGLPSHGADVQDVPGAVDLRVAHHSRVDELAAADRLLLGVALGLIGHPPFLMVDDLHEDLTPDERRLVMIRLRDVAVSGVTVVAGSLDPALAADADVVLTLPGTRPTSALDESEEVVYALA